MSHALFSGRRAFLLALPALTACAQPQVEQLGGSSGPRLPRPDRINVVAPGVAPGDVKLDEGVWSCPVAVNPLRLRQDVFHETQIPGAAGTMRADAAVGGLAEVAASNAILSGVSEARSAHTGSKGRRIADALGLRLGRVFAQQGWIGESVVQ